MKAESSNAVLKQAHAVVSWQPRLAALFEVTGVFLVGSFLAAILARLTGMQALGGLLRSASADRQPDFSELAWVAAENLLLQYACLLGIAFLIGWWHRKRRWQAYGLTTAEHSLRYLVLAGIVLFAVATLPGQLLFLLNKYFPLGPGADHWALLAHDWTLEFWLFMAVASFGLVPIVEELFVRGYVQTRLGEDFGPASAILITSFFFALSHTQYHKLSALTIGMILTIIFSSICSGYVFYRTKSLLAPIICHAIGNIPNTSLLPTKSLVDFLIPALMVVIVYLFRRQIAAYARQLWQELISIPTPRATSAAAVFAALLVLSFTFLPLVLPVVAGVAFLTALFLEYKEKLRPKHAPVKG